MSVRAACVCASAQVQAKQGNSAKGHDERPAAGFSLSLSLVSSPLFLENAHTERGRAKEGDRLELNSS